MLDKEKRNLIFCWSRRNCSSKQEADRSNKQAIFKDCAPFTDCIDQINNTKIDHGIDLDAVMLMYNLMKYSDNYSGTTRILLKYCKGKPKNLVTDSNGFKFISRCLYNTNKDGIVNSEIVVPLNT